MASFEFDAPGGRLSATLDQPDDAMAILLFAPLILEAINQPFYLDVLSRALIFAIAVISLNLILGFGGMVSLGHAAYIGAYQPSSSGE